MEDVVCVEFHKGDDGETIEFVYFAVFDGHGGKEAACFAKEHLLKEITKHRGFWSDDDRHVLKAITDGFISTHKLMWKTVGESHFGTFLYRNQTKTRPSLTVSIQYYSSAVWRVPSSRQWAFAIHERNRISRVIGC